MSIGNQYWEKMICSVVRHTVEQRKRKPIEGTLVHHHKTMKKVYRRKGRKPVHGSALLDVRTDGDEDREAIRMFMQDFGVDSTLIESTLAAWDEHMYSMKDRVLRGERLYRWSAVGGGKTVHWTFGIKSILALINALVQCMPEPVQAIRDTLVHGKPKKCDDGTVDQYVAFDYGSGVQEYTRFVVAICIPYAVRKIMAYERQKTGNVYERSLHRTTDMGQGGRRFSDADISDILSRTILATFFPLYCRTLPLTNKGKAYIVVKDCSVIGNKKVGKRTLMVKRGSGQLKKLWNTVKMFRENKITEQEYNDFLSKFKIPPKGKRYTFEQQTENGYWTIIQCNQTEQKFRVFTRSAYKAEELRSLKGFTAEANDIIPVDKNTPIEIDAKDMYGFSPDRVFFRMLKGMTRNLYRFLMRRTDYDNQLISEHADSRRLRKNREQLFSLNEVLQNDDGTLTTVQKDIINAELSLKDCPRSVHRNNRRAWLYNLIVETRTGVNPNLTKYQYNQMKDAELHCIGVQLGLIEEQAEQVTTDYDESDDIGHLSTYQVPQWIRDRANREQLTSFETAFAIQSGLNKSTPHWPSPVSVCRLPYWVWDNDMGMVYVRPYEQQVAYLKPMLASYGGEKITEQLKPVQYPKLSRPMARYIAGVRAITGLPDMENPIHHPYPVDVSSTVINGFEVPIWTTEHVTHVQCDSGNGVLVKDTALVKYVDTLTADGDGI